MTGENTALWRAPTCTYCPAPAVRLSPGGRDGLINVCAACWEAMCAMGQQRLPFDPVVRLVDSDYVIPDELSVDRLCWRCGGSGQRSARETLHSPGDHPCPACRPADAKVSETPMSASELPIGTADRNCRWDTDEWRTIATTIQNLVEALLEFLVWGGCVFVGLAAIAAVVTCGIGVWRLWDWMLG